MLEPLAAAIEFISRAVRSARRRPPPAVAILLATLYDS